MSPRDVFVLFFFYHASCSRPDKRVSASGRKKIRIPDGGELHFGVNGNCENGESLAK